MQEILTAVTYVVAWLVCEKVIGIESGLIKLIISLGLAIAVYVACWYEEKRRKKAGQEEEGFVTVSRNSREKDRPAGEEPDGSFHRESPRRLSHSHLCHRQKPQDHSLEQGLCGSHGLSCPQHDRHGHHYKPLYPEKRPLIADLIVDSDFEGLNRYYGKKRVQQSSVIEGAYEATDLFEILGGKPRYLYFLAAPVYDDSGEVIAAIETLQDVTRERELARCLRENAETLRRELDENIRLRKTIEGIIEGSPIPDLRHRQDHRVILWNRAFTEMSGYPGEMMIGTNNQWMPFYPEKRPVIADLIVDGDTRGLEAFYAKKRVHKSSVIEGAYEATDFYENLGGRSRHLYFLAAPICDEKGEIIAAVETLQDVTRERELERSLKEQAETLKRELEGNIRLRKTIEGIIEGSPIPTFVIDRNHTVILWNPAFTEMSGYRREKMIGTDNQWMPFYKEKRPVIADLIVDSDLEGLEKFYGKKKVQKSAVVEGAYEATDFYQNLGGKRRHLYFLAAPILDEKGEVIAAIETLQDVTREREMELSLKEYAETMRNELEENIHLRKNMEALFNFHQSILDSSPDRIIVLNAEGIVSYMSRDIDAERGLTAKKLKGQALLRIHRTGATGIPEGALG